jgi:hypothetical protein
MCLKHGADGKALFFGLKHNKAGSVETCFVDKQKRFLVMYFSGGWTGAAAKNGARPEVYYLRKSISA